MAEYVAVATQEVAANENVTFTNTSVKGSNCIQHREGSGIITLRGLTNQCQARFFVGFSANIALPAGGTVAPISLAIAISNVSSGIFISVPRGCCVNIAVENTSGVAIEVANANLIVNRVA